MLTQQQLDSLISQLGDNSDAAGRDQAHRDLQKCLRDDECAGQFEPEIREAYDDLGLDPDDDRIAMIPEQEKDD
jgi:hypothetical protein